MPRLTRATTTLIGSVFWRDMVFCVPPQIEESFARGIANSIDCDKNNGVAARNDMHMELMG